MTKPLLNTYELSWKPERKRLTKPYYLSLAAALKEDILQGKLPAYTQLPPQRELARYLELNVSTITKAYKLCETNGLVSAAVGRGTFVAPLAIMHHPFAQSTRPGTQDGFVPALAPMLDGVSELSPASAPFPNQTISYDNSFIPEGVINMAYQTSSLTHCDLVREIGAQVMSKPESANLFGNSAYLGSPFQIEAGKQWLTERGVDLTGKSSVFITMGVPHALSIMLASLFQPDITVAMDAYTSPYTAATLARLLHAKMVPIENDHEGMSAKALEAACRVGKIQALYVLPSGNPTAIAISDQRKRELADVAQRYNLLVVEDDHMAPFQPTTPAPLFNLTPDTAMYVSSVSQAISPGLRISYIVVPNRYKELIAETLFASMHKISPFDAEISAEIITRGVHHQLIAEKREKIQSRNACFARYFPAVQASSLAYGQWVTLPEGLMGQQAQNDLRALGVQTLAARHFALGERARDTALYLATCGPKTIQELEDGLQIVRDYWDTSLTNLRFPT